MKYPNALARFTATLKAEAVRLSKRDLLELTTGAIALCQDGGTIDGHTELIAALTELAGQGSIEALATVFVLSGESAHSMDAFDAFITRSPELMAALHETSKTSAGEIDALGQNLIDGGRYQWVRDRAGKRRFLPK